MSSRIFLAYQRSVASATSPLDQTMRFVVYRLKEAETMLAPAGSTPGATTFSVVFDLGGAKAQNVDVKLVQRFIFILTNFYPERLGVMCLLDAPGFFLPFCWPLIKPFLNPATRDKVKFVSSRAAPGSEESLTGWVGRECLPRALGGEQEPEQPAVGAPAAPAAS